jgi:hypothetical protein
MPALVKEDGDVSCIVVPPREPAIPGDAAQASKQTAVGIKRIRFDFI